MRRITGLALAAMLMVSMLAGCGENGTVDQNNTTGMIEQGANDMKNDMTKEAQRAKDSAENGINSVDEAMQNEEGMIMAAGTRIQDVVMKLGETFGITMPQKLDETALKDVFGIDPANIEEYYGEYSAVNTSADHLIGLKVKMVRSMRCALHWKTVRTRLLRISRNICQISTRRHRQDASFKRVTTCSWLLAETQMPGMDLTVR